MSPWLAFASCERRCSDCRSRSTATSTRSTCGSTSAARSSDEWRKGVAFVKEIVPRRAIAFVARTLYNENYVRMPMRSAVRHARARFATSGGTRGLWEGVSGNRRRRIDVPGPEAEETFITEHYWGYARQADGSTVEYGGRARALARLAVQDAGPELSGRIALWRAVRQGTSPGPPASAFWPTVRRSSSAAGSAYVERPAVRTLHFDCFSGISGDMTLAALFDAGVDPDAVRAGLDSLGLPITLEVEKVKRKRLRGHVRQRRRARTRRTTASCPTSRRS